MEENNNNVTFKKVTNHQPFIYDDFDKCLRQLKLASVTWNIKRGETTIKWLTAETNEIIVGDLSDYDVYASKETFSNGNKIGAGLYKEASAYDIFSLLSRRYMNIEDGRCYVWTFEDGQAVKWFYDEHISSVTFNTEDNTFKSDVEIPESYRSASDVYFYNDYEVVNNDGTKEFHEAMGKRIFLTDEQNALVDKLQSILEECEKAGVTIVMDYYDYSIKAYNKAATGEVEYSPCVDGEKQVAVKVDLERARIITGICDINTDDDYYFVYDKSDIKTSK